MAIHYRRILELAQDHSQRSIAASTGHSRRKVKEVLDRAHLVDFTEPIDPALTDVKIGRILFPELSPEATGRELPDLDYMHEELGKKNVTLSLLITSIRRIAASPGKYHILIDHFAGCMVILRRSSKPRCAFVVSLEN